MGPCSPRKDSLALCFTATPTRSLGNTNVQKAAPRNGFKSQHYGSFGKIISSHASKILLLLLILCAGNYPQSSCLFILSKPACCPSTYRCWAPPELTVERCCLEAMGNDRLGWDSIIPVPTEGSRPTTAVGRILLASSAKSMASQMPLPSASV